MVHDANRQYRWTAWVFWMVSGAAIATPQPDQCAKIPDDASRLTCYDNALRTDPSPVIDSNVGVEDTTMPASSWLDKAWELTPADKRGTFIVKTHLPNFVLPVHVTSRINRLPASPTHPAGPVDGHYVSTEGKFQISLKTKVYEGLLLPNADLWFAYTQRSLWQVWNKKDSAPFRSTDYEPEMVYVVPMSERMPALPAQWRWRMVQWGLVHQSNGQSNALSRSWNRTYVGAAFDHGPFAVSLRVHHRFKEGGSDDNPDLTNYLGAGEITGAWIDGPQALILTWRTNFKSTHRGSLQLDWTHAVHSDKPTGLRWYVQLFSGYGETLLDYNHRQNSLGVGVTVFQF
ncbi:MAG: phospholipase A [Acidobacteriota bacterium]